MADNRAGLVNAAPSNCIVTRLRSVQRRPGAGGVPSGHCAAASGLARLNDACELRRSRQSLGSRPGGTRCKLSTVSGIGFRRPLITRLTLSSSTHGGLIDTTNSRPISGVRRGYCRSIVANTSTSKQFGWSAEMSAFAQAGSAVAATRARSQAKILSVVANLGFFMRRLGTIGDLHANLFSDPALPVASRLEPNSSRSIVVIVNLTELAHLRRRSGAVRACSELGRDRCGRENPFCKDPAAALRSVAGLNCASLLSPHCRRSIQRLETAGSRR